MEDQYLVLRVIRCLLAMDNNKGQMKGIRGDTQVIGVEWLVEMIRPVEKWNEDDILTAIDCVLYNCLDNDISLDKSCVTRGFYPIANLLEQSCISNSRNIISGDYLECRATVFIPQGAAITTSRVDPILDVFSRRKQLRENHHIDCFCERCCSTTELGALTSALCCLACENILGFFLPPHPAESVPHYTCNICEYMIPETMASKATQELIPIVQEFSMFDIDEQADFLDNLLTKFHDNHSLVLQMKLHIVKKLGRDEQGNIKKTEAKVVEKKVQYCKEVLEVLDKVEPGLTIRRGLLLYELGETFLARGGINNTQQCQDYLAEAAECFENENDFQWRQLMRKIKLLIHHNTM